MSVGLRLKEERERLRLSRSEFATRMGVHRNTQARYESDNREPGAAYWDAAIALGIDVDYVTGRKKHYSLGDKSPDPALLTKVLESVESILASSGVILDPEKKARTVVFLYKVSYWADLPNPPEVS